MPKKREGASVWWYIFLIVLFLLLLKTFKVLPDPPEYFEIAASIGAAVGVTAGIGSLHNHMFKFEHRLTAVETRLDTMQDDMKAIKNKLGIS